MIISVPPPPNFSQYPMIMLANCLVVGWVGGVGGGGGFTCTVGLLDEWLSASESVTIAMALYII